VALAATLAAGNATEIALVVSVRAVSKFSPSPEPFVTRGLPIPMTWTAQALESSAVVSHDNRFQAGDGITPGG
jgi:hypothetical protein